MSTDLDIDQKAKKLPLKMIRLKKHKLRKALLARKGKKMYIITAVYHGERITRKAYSDFQAFTIINQLYRDGCHDVGMREEDEHEAVY